MIAKMIKGTGFRGAVEYDLQKHKSILLQKNMGADEPKSLAKEFGLVRALRPNLQKAVCHVSLSLPPEEILSDTQWLRAAHAWLNGMGFVKNQYIISRHTDAEHQHIHILVNRICLDGSVVSDAHDFKRQEKIMRQIEQELGLRQVASSQEVKRKSLTKGEIEQALRTKEQPIRLQLQTLIDDALNISHNFAKFKAFLSQHSVNIRLNQASTGHISGISFMLNEIAFKGSSLGKGYTWKSLQEKGLIYEQVRHNPEHEQETIQRNGTNPSQIEPAATTRRLEDQEYAGEVKIKNSKNITVYSLIILYFFL